MNVSKRIKEIASLINDNVNVIDIGCDHAYLDIYLTLNRENVYCSACDINKNALEMAKKNIDRYSLNGKIETYLCDGLDEITVDNNSIIVISGMGTSTIMHILDNEKCKKANEIIVQSNNNIIDLRMAMIKKGFFIANEKVVNDKDKYYVIMTFKQGKRKYNKAQLKFGPFIIKNYLDNKDYFKYLLKKEENKYKSIPIKHFKTRLEAWHNIKLLKKIMCFPK